MKIKLLAYLLSWQRQQVKTRMIAIKMKMQLNRKKKLFPDVCASTLFIPDDGLISLNKTSSVPGKASSKSSLVSVK